ncbi:MAG: RidA family protein [Lachnospiraceae bacterium]
MMKKISTDKAPAAIGPYSQAVAAGGFLYASGQIPINPETGNVEAQGIVAQAEQAMINVGEILKAAGAAYDRVVKTTCFLADIADFAAFNEVYAKYFTHNPARSCVAVKDLPKGVLCEVEVVAYLGD